MYSSFLFRNAKGKLVDFEVWMITARFVLPSSLSLCLGFQYKLHVPRCKGRILSGISSASESLSGMEALFPEGAENDAQESVSQPGYIKRDITVYQHYMVERVLLHF